MAQSASGAKCKVPTAIRPNDKCSRGIEQAMKQRCSSRKSKVADRMVLRTDGEWDESETGDEGISDVPWHKRGGANAKALVPTKVSGPRVKDQLSTVPMRSHKVK